jgi:hypothetical protein
MLLGAEPVAMLSKTANAHADQGVHAPERARALRRQAVPAEVRHDRRRRHADHRPGLVDVLASDAASTLRAAPRALAWFDQLG